ncbi:hypothetical protein ILUMI_07990 [Ignelater luminosus]|uniref:Uncharacterized protein n=1 Tax=Ignelater luminosus TaxID=2038154 RepID=A0A8K0GGC3_IGNLU|nr:hypothetical protein ILUMI_07990 [Ignelater luminosus]
MLFKKGRYHMGFVSMCLWTIAAIVAAAQTETSSNVTGVSVTFKMQDVLLMLFTTCLLARGISIGNPYLFYPWVILSTWSLYQSQYPGLIKMLHILKRTKGVSRLACVAFGIDVLGIVTKLILIYRIAHLSVNLWYQKKLQHETMNKI